ncbi:MAG: hypothetical protein V3R64_01560 [Sphingomonadales bacterium]
MRYLSTRGAKSPKSFQDIILEGMAPDGGLYLPNLNHADLNSLALPAALTSLKEAPETCHTIKADARELEKFIKAQTHDR